jgi:hypothetical protein
MVLTVFFFICFGGMNLKMTKLAIYEKLILLRRKEHSLLHATLFAKSGST